MDKQQAEELYRDFGKALFGGGINRGWEVYVLSSHTEFERAFGKTASKRRKLYNGMLKCELYMYK